MNQQEDRKMPQDQSASVNGSGLQGPRRDPTKVNYFTPYLSGDVVDLGGQDWQVKHDTPGWYLTSTGDWKGEHPTIRHIKSMNDLIYRIEEASQAAQTDRKPQEPAVQIRMDWHEGVSAENVNFVGLILTTQAAIDADEGPAGGDLVQIETTVVSDLFDQVCAAVNERNPKSGSEAIQFAIATLDALPADADALRLRGRLEAALTGWDLSEAPNVGEFQTFRYDDETESGFIIRNEGDGRFKAEDWRDGDIVDNTYGTYAEAKAWTEVEAARKDLALLVSLDGAAGVEPVFQRDLAGYTGLAAAKELFENWDDALRNDPSGKVVGNLLGDVDAAVAALMAFRARVSAVLPARYQTIAPQQTSDSLDSQAPLTEEKVFKVARRHGIQSYLVHDRQLVAFVEAVLGHSIPKASSVLENPEQKASLPTPGV